MPLETGVVYINDLVITNPVTGDPRSEGDDHIRNIKNAIKNTFPGMVGRAWRVQSISGNDSPDANDNMTVFLCTATLTLAPVAAASLGNGHMFLVYASAGDVLIDPNGAELINGSATLTVPVGHMAVVFCEGGAFYAAIMNTLAPWTTGDAKLTFKTASDPGWVLANDGSIGSALSGATTRAHADTLALYTLLWNNISNTYAPVSTGRGANAAADFAAHKTLTLPRALGRALALAGGGSGLTARALGEFLGTETHVLTADQMPVHNHGVNDPGHYHTTNAGSPLTPSGGGPQFPQYTPGTPTSTNTTGITIQNAGGGAAHPNMQPTSFWNAMIKL